LQGVDNTHVSGEHGGRWFFVVFLVVARGGSKVVPIHPQYVVDENEHRQAVLVPLAEWEQIVDELDELDDIRSYDEAKAGSQETIAFEQAVREIQEGRDA
jgi:PHD/YefM family antitoxin component YafN of YafNO toxin-antitoxin module